MDLLEEVYKAGNFKMWKLLPLKCCPEIVV